MINVMLMILSSKNARPLTWLYQGSAFVVLSDAKRKHRRTRNQPKQGKRNLCVLKQWAAVDQKQTQQEHWEAPARGTPSAFTDARPLVLRHLHSHISFIWLRPACATLSLPLRRFGLGDHLFSCYESSLPSVEGV